ncbi:hypothetical protein EYB26_003630 [Talaromyces marneffei]|uniref:uncharacterized protein n=1 Tax=Talaromyces marneffei TaxID=37727 RepID=UPI0012A8DF34|nr:uncharacterized protein EYB26_003630 [Talaromyces marneffei]QGA15963.1 hypothetical protein EYB26_003630 [Talaromyces marneffei]
MFENGFKEGQQLQAALEDMEGIVSVQSLEAFLQWLYLREVSFDLDEPESQISAAIELARFADMCKITRIESYIAEYFKRILVKNPEPEPVEFGIDINTYFLTSQHIVSTTFLPRGHTVRRILAAAMVEQSLLCEDDLISQQIYKYPTFGVDLLEEVRKTLKGMTIGQ